MTAAKVKLRVEQVKLADMIPAPWNPRTITEAQLEALRLSLAEFGAVEPVVLNADGMILGGHQRYEAATSLGWDSFPAVRVDVDEKQARQLNLALNRISGEWDVPLLAIVVEGLTTADLLVTGFDDVEIAQMLAGIGDVVPPGEFGEPNLTTDHRCPSCRYEWSGPCQ